jgi:hypothetical protein
LIRQAVRAAIRRLEQALRERRVADSYRCAYTATPLTAEETRVLDAAAALASERQSKQ